ncbi:MAG: sigma factor-like helix-turn-helix DNA-binding protein [Kofleriaceae bacterium]
MSEVGSADAIDTAWNAGREAWPEIHCDRERFAAYVTQHDRIATRYPADVYLAAACLAGDTTALATFDREVLGTARGAVRSIDSSETFVDEACQRLRSSLLVGDGVRPRIADYAGRGPLRAWVGVAAVRQALMMRRSQQRSREVSEDDWSGTLALISTGNPELELLKRQYSDAFATALRQAVAALEPRLRTVLRMSFVEALSIDEIGAVYAVHRATAARWIRSACDAVFTGTRVALADQLRLSPTEVDRVTAMVQSQLDVSLSQLLPESLDT